jgi:quinol monooxygenase YgiN
MFMRLVQVRIKPERRADFLRLYEEVIMPNLQSTPGCLYAGLVQSIRRDDEGISLTIWDSPRDAEAYEKSGAFQQMIEQSKPFFSDSSEWRMQLSKDLQLEYAPVAHEPVVTSYAHATEAGTGPPVSGHGSFLYLRMVSMRVQPEKTAEFKSIFENEVLPPLRSTAGCLYVYLVDNVEQKDEWLSVTIWNSKADADSYEQSGAFDRLRAKLESTFSSLFQWKVGLDKQLGKQAVTTDDLSVSGYTVVAGKAFR